MKVDSLSALIFLKYTFFATPKYNVFLQDISQYCIISEFTVTPRSADDAGKKF